MKSKFIVFIIALIVVVVGLGVFMNKSQGPSKYDDFAKALKTGGAEFYGAFWCPHCQAEKALFGSAKKFLPYIECSNPDQSPIQVCLDKKVESYPTWMFKDPIKLLSKSQPTICPIKPGTPNDASICAQIASKYYKTWVFPEYQFSIKSPTDPVSKDGVWTFPVGAQTQGEIPLKFLADQIGFTLPQ